MKKLIFFVLTIFLLSPKAYAAISDHELQLAANQINQKLPVMIDEYTRLDKVLGFDNTMKYFYTLLNYNKDKISIDDLRNIIQGKRESVKNSICTSANIKSLVLENINFKYYYRDEDGKDILIILIKSSECEQ